MDTVYLKIVQSINEADGRIVGRQGNTGAVDMGPGGIINKYDWRVWNGAGFGRQLSGQLGGGRGYAYEVSDMGQYVSCRASYHSVATGKTISKTFVISFENPKVGDGKVFATSTKWRTISNVGQAANYIKSTIQALASQADSLN